MATKNSHADSLFAIAISAARNAFSAWDTVPFARRKAILAISSVLCGMATSLGQLILFRVMQGLAGGGLQPSRQTVVGALLGRGIDARWLIAPAY